MAKIDWKAKLGSRKLWCAVAAWLTSLLTAFGATENTVARVTIIAGGFGALVVYMLAEAKVDASRAAAQATAGTEAGTTPGMGAK